ncbi:MAG TPA: hypothetical protein VMT86_13215 [Bryobacteraceae bacterium]|nr:hypothetical protein [Bryobacteraceae bacterium]
MLALCGILDAACAAMNLLMLNPDAPNMVRNMSMLALAAGVCAVVAGLPFSGRGSSWLLALHGLALGTFGLIGVSPLVRGPLSFRALSVLFVLMAGSIALFALRAVQTRRTGTPDTWFFSVIGVASMGFAISFIAVGFGWIRPGPQTFWTGMGSYFGVCAVFMLYLALRGGSQASVPLIRTPRHAH